MNTQSNPESRPYYTPDADTLAVLAQVRDKLCKPTSPSGAPT